MEKNTNSGITCVAHRGGPGDNYKKENSIAAIKNSLAMGVPAIEIDVWQVDGKLVVFHDRRLSRFTDSQQRLDQFNYDQLQKLADRFQFEIPTLEQVIDTINGQALLNIEIKGPDCALAIGELIQARVAQGKNKIDDFIVSSFDHPQLQLSKAHFPDIKRGLLICGIPIDLAQQAETLDCYFLGMSLEFIDQALVEDCHQKGIKAWVYTVNHLEDMRWLKAIGVDAIFCDYPERALSL